MTGAKDQHRGQQRKRRGECHTKPHLQNFHEANSVRAASREGKETASTGGMQTNDCIKRNVTFERRRQLAKVYAQDCPTT